MQALRPCFKLLVTLIILSLPFHGVQSAADGWSLVADGIDYQVFPSPTQPFSIYVARMNRTNQNVFIESSLALQAFTGSGSWATVRQMANRYDGAINTWGGAWGGRNRVVVAINGDYFDTKTNTPEKGVIHSGWFDKRFLDRNGWSGFVWKTDRSAFIGECVVQPPERQYITFVDDLSQNQIDGINIPRGEGQLILYTSDYGSITPRSNDDGVEMVVEMERPAGIRPDPVYAQGKVLSVRSGRGETPIPFDAVVISASGNPSKSLITHSSENSLVRITQEIGSWDAAQCTRNLGSTKDWTNAYASIGGAYAVLQNGVVDGNVDNSGATEGAPRTAVALNGQYIFFIVTDGIEKPDNNQGMSFAQVGQFARDTLGATWAIIEDGGGSSTMVINGAVVNHPSDCPPGQVDTNPCERRVVNGLMMVAQQPLALSGAFSTGEITRTLVPTDLRLGPGTNYGAFTQLPTQAEVTVLPESHGINGVLAKNSYWWKVAAGEQVGWISEVSLNGKLLMLPLIFQSR
ncbi:MAG: phosphodiester glycosidase family protein [Anaerolineaceae bacterium]|nr:phosphodiester glycosidase family protein [Anaerolineaceae bacterium]